MVAYVAAPNEFLANAEYKKDGRYSHDPSNRPIKFLHGYELNQKKLPSLIIPRLSIEDVNDLHEKKIIPLLKKKLAEEKNDPGSAQGDDSANPIVKGIPATVFELLPDTVGINECFTPGAIAKMQACASTGQPVAFVYEPNNKAACKELSPFSERLAAREAERKKNASQASVSSSPSGGSNSSSHKKEGMSNGAKLAIAGGSVALVAVIGYWVWNMMHRKNQNKNQQAGLNMW